MIDNPRFFLDQDDDGHWFIVPESIREEWDAWRELISSYGNGETNDFPEMPEGVETLGGGPQHVTFTDPEYD